MEKIRSVPDILSGDNFLSIYFKSVKEYKKICSRAVAEYNFMPNEIEVLMFLTNNKGRNTAKEISLYKGISKSLVCKSVDSLVRRGFLFRKTDESDKRIDRLFLTESALDIAEKLQENKMEFIASIARDIPAEELVIFKKVLDKMLSNLEYNQNNG